jgi:hypothetical protein
LVQASNGKSLDEELLLGLEHASKTGSLAPLVYVKKIPRRSREENRRGCKGGRGQSKAMRPGGGLRPLLGAPRIASLD